MNSVKAMTLALCAAACSVMTAFGDGAAPVATASSTTIADPVNPKPGLVFKGYDVRAGHFEDLPSILEKTAAVKMTVVTDDKFAYGNFQNVHIGQGVWEGFVQCKRSANCTILVQQASYNGCGYILFVNGKRICCGHGQMSRLVDLKVGFNHIKLVAQNAGHNPVLIRIKATGSVKEPKQLTPKVMFHDEKPDDGDVF